MTDDSLRGRSACLCDTFSEVMSDFAYELQGKLARYEPLSLRRKSKLSFGCTALICLGSQPDFVSSVLTFTFSFTYPDPVALYEVHVAI